MATEYEIRTASKFDVELINTLFCSAAARHFGVKREPPLSQLFYEYQTHRLIVYKTSDPTILLAYCEFCIYPNIPVLANDCWPQWLQCRFCIDAPITLMNTIFFNFYIYIEEHTNLLRQILEEVFYREHKVSFLVVARPPNYSYKEFEKLEAFGKVYYPIAFDMFSRRNLPTIIIISRHSFMPQISFRKALPEDNDDVIEMIDVYEPDLREEHGDYFIAEMLMGTAGGNLDRDKIIVTEDRTSDGSTGMMWLSEDVKIEEMVKNFDLENMGNLVKCTPDVPHGVVSLEVFTASQRPHVSLNAALFDSKRRTVRLSGMQEIPESQKKDITEKEQFFTRMKYICDEVRNSSNYLDKISKTLKITFDLPAGRSIPKNKKVNLNKVSGAFILKNFILHPSLRLEYTYYYLCAMFSAYPDRDYCVVPIPPGTKFSLSLSALLRFFLRVEHRPSCEMSDEIFVAHRCSISTELSVFRLEKEDLANVYNFINFTNKDASTDSSSSSSFQDHLSEYHDYLCKVVKQISADVLYNKMSDFSFWIFRCGHMGRENTTTVGFAILRPFSNYDAVYKQFMLPPEEDYMTYDRGELVMLRLHPYFHMWSDELLRTVSIRSGFREIYYLQDIFGKTLPNDLATKMMPVEPRRMRRNWFIDTKSEGCYRRSSKLVDLLKINCVVDQFYLFRHNLFPSKSFSNQSPIVIVGLSDICKAFLRLMVFGWNTPDFSHVSVNNCLPIVEITVIVNYGEIEAEYDTHTKCCYCSSKDKCYLNNANSCPFVMDTTQRLDMRNWISFVAGKVESIDRSSKFVSLDNNCKIYYEKLLLLSDTKFGIPALAQDADSQSYSSEMPYNYTHINGRLDKILLYHKLVELNRSKLAHKHIIIYGYTLALYECIDFLLKHGCSPKDIVYVQPRKVYQAEYLNDPTNDMNLDNILVQMVDDLGIRVHESAQLVSWTLYQKTNFIQNVKFKYFPSDASLNLSCNLFINFSECYMTTSMERVLINSKIELENSKIIVDEDFCTNDPCIYATGNHVIFLNDVYYQYTYTSACEMAQKLINIMQLNPEPIKKERKFCKPCLFHALLPLGHMIIKITVPKRFLLGDLSNEYSHTMTTYDKEFFRVRMNRNHIIEELVCVTRRLDKPLYFLEYFCGKHEKLLNNLHSRWKMGIIKNFVSFFEDPWTEYMMHDRFDEMQAKNHATLISLLQHMNQGIVGMNLGDSDFQDACKHFLEANLLKFLRTYRKEFVNKFALPEDWEEQDEF